MKGRKIELGQKFGRLTVIGIPLQDVSAWKMRFYCLCDCGNKKEVSGRALTHRTQSVKSCGCLRNENLIKSKRTHGLSHIPEYDSWRRAVRRCFNQNDPLFHNYGGRGIIVCDRWRYSFENFLADMGPRPSELHSLDRYPDNNGNYEPGNCRWATSMEQNNNRRSNVHVNVGGEKMTVTQAARTIGIEPEKFRKRLYSGFPLETALTTSSLITHRRSRRNHWVEVNGEKMIVAELARRVGLSPYLLKDRLRRGWSVEKAISKKNWNFTPHPGRGGRKAT